MSGKEVYTCPILGAIEKIVICWPKSISLINYHFKPIFNETFSLWMTMFMIQLLCYPGLSIYERQDELLVYLYERSKTF